MYRTIKMYEDYAVLYICIRLFVIYNTDSAKSDTSVKYCTVISVVSTL